MFYIYILAFYGQGLMATILILCKNCRVNFFLLNDKGISYTSENNLSIMDLLKSPSACFNS